MINKEWVDASFCFARYLQPHAVSGDIQCLGHVETILTDWEEKFTSIHHLMQTSDYDFNADPDKFLLTYIYMQFHECGF